MSISRLSIAALAAALAACSAAPAANAATLTTPTVTVASANGTGCPAGTVTTTVAPDGSSVTASYSAFTARAGTGSVFGEDRRVCQFSIAIASPGQRWSVTSATEHGAIDLPTGGTALQRTSYYLQGTTPTAVVDHPAAGPVTGSWDQSDPAPFAAPCGNVRNLTVKVELRATSPGPAASLSLNGATPGTTVNLGYSNCP